ncbi:efflux RND transporter permease subunit [Candidatus Rariloculus sp.]|uniref:efflux RND transporter permease subunit n=1 Tax=Candidatus Rariloculus sp. TaxID=3101265 RepID=UPI003D0A3118
MRSIIQWFVDNPVAANLLMAVLVVGGLISLSNTRQEEFPAVDLEIVTVTVPFLGATPEEVEEGVCIRIEEALEGTENVFKMTSTSSEGSCSVNVELESGSDTIKALNDIKSKIDSINTFPAQTERPIVSQVAVTSQVADIVISGQTDERTLKTLAQEMREDIAAIDGISQVTMEYVRPDELSIEVSENTLRRYGLTLDTVANAIRRSSLDLPGGAIKTGGGEILVRTKGQYYVGQEFEDIVVVTREDGTALTLGEVARVIDGFEEGDLSVRFNGAPAAMVRVYRIGNEDTIESSEKVGAYLEEARARLPEGIDLTIWRDSANELGARLNVLLSTAGGGLALVLLVLALPLRFRLAMWVAAGIPIALLGSVMTFGFFDVTLSTLTVMGFILVLGIVVDDAIVVGERIYAHERDAEDQRTAAVNGTHEVAVPVIFGVLTTVAAFMPIIFVPGRLGQFFAVVGIVVCICLAFSIIESMMILPSHLSHRKRARDTEQGPRMQKWLGFQNRLAEGLENFAEHKYGGRLRAILPWRYSVLAAGGGVLIIMGGLALSGRIGFQFFPAIEGNQVTASLTMPEGINVAETTRAAEQIELAAQELIAELDAEYPETPGIVQYLLTSVGRSASRGGGPRANVVSPALSHRAEIALALLPTSERGGVTANEISQRWRELAGTVPDAVELSFSSDAFTAGAAISIELRGRNVDDLREAATLVRGELARFNGVTDITDSFRSGKQEAKLSLRPEARTFGLTLNDLASQARQAFYGEEAQRIQRGTEDVRVMVRYPEDERRSLGDLEDMRIRTDTGVEVPFASVANVEFGNGYSSIQRVDRQRVVTVTADVVRSVTTPERVLASLQSGALPEILSNYRSVSYTLSGEQEERNEAIGGLFSLVPMALLVIYAILAIPLKSYFQPIVIMSVIPFGTVGAILGHMIMGWSLGLPSVLGMIALSGVVVNSSLVLVDYINRQRRLGIDLREAVARAGVVRFRPILLTSVTTFVGLAPLMLRDVPETAFIVPMAISLAWGVVFATIITLFLVPCLYLALEDFIKWDVPDTPADIVPSTHRVTGTG